MATVGLYATISEARQSATKFGIPTAASGGRFTASAGDKITDVTFFTHSKSMEFTIFCARADTNIITHTYTFTTDAVDPPDLRVTRSVNWSLDDGVEYYLGGMPASSAGLGYNSTEVPAENTVRLSSGVTYPPTVGDDCAPDSYTATQSHILYGTLTAAPSSTTINVDIPADIDLEWGTTHELAVTHDGGTTTLSGVTLSAPTGWEYVVFTTAPDPGATESFYEYAQTDTAVGSYTLQAGDLLAWETQTGLTVDGQTIPTVNPAATVTGAYKIWSTALGSWSATSSFIINNLGQFVGIASVDSDNEINVNQVVTVQTEGFPTIEPSEWYAWYQGEPMDKVSWNSGQPQVRVPTSTGLSVDSSGDLVITWRNA